MVETHPQPAGSMLSAIITTHESYCAKIRLVPDGPSKSKYAHNRDRPVVYSQKEI